MPVACAIFLAVAFGVLFGIMFQRQRFWPWPAVDQVLEAAKSYRDFGALIPHGRRMEAPKGSPRERFTIHDPAGMHGGYYAFAGWDDSRQGYVAWLHDASGKLLHVWPLDYRRLDMGHLHEDDDGPHGFVVMPDGSVIVNFDAASAMGRFDACGQAMWKREGVFHHQISRAPDGNLWTWRGDDVTAYGHYQYLQKFDPATGAQVRQIGLIEDVLPADPEAPALFGVRKDFEFRKLDKLPDRRWNFDLFHPNDIEELSPELAPMFPMFAAGDLLISIRRMNLVAVLDGTDYHVKWWSHGPWISQHDPDFTEDGKISVYNNNTTRGPSSIVRIDPATREVSELPAAANAGWSSRFMGVHQYLPNGNVFIVSPGEGRAFERSPTGELVMEFNNVAAPGSRFNDHIENGVWLPADFFTELPNCKGDGS